MPDCPHCGDPLDEHGKDPCRPALATRLADEIAGHQDDRQHIYALELRVAELERKLDERELPRFHA